jgi:hypothetical protein
VNRGQHLLRVRQRTGALVFAVLGLGAALVGASAPLAAQDRAHAQPPRVTFDDRASDRLVVTTQGYQLTLSKRNGRILGVVDRERRTRVVPRANGCLWRESARGGPPPGGCSFRPRGARRFSYRWDPASATLTMRYSSDLGSVVVTLAAHTTFFDLVLTLANHGGLVTAVSFPDGLRGDDRTVEAGYAPNVLPGVRLKPGFFSRVGNNIETYPSRWAFADYLALDVGISHLSLYSTAPSGPIHPTLLGFLHDAPGGHCSGNWFCLVHRFQTWIGTGGSWTSPTVRVRIGETTEQSILAYRHDNGIDGYPSLQSKLGSRMSTLAEAPLIKADLTRLKPFRDWGPELRQLPRPALLHPVAFQPGGHDQSDPDFLPPDPHWGSSADFSAMVEQAHSLGQMVMPYLNVSWWSPTSRTMRSLPPPLELQDVAALDEHGRPVINTYGDHSGVVVSPFVPFVRERVDRLLEEWRTEVPADCVFFDQLGARAWMRDFNPASPNPDAYYDGWLQVMAPYANRCLMVEDGWDRLARDFTGFHGSLLMMSRELGAPDSVFGKGNWEPYPLADWLFHDKVLLYQHDLYEGTMATDTEVLTWNLAFGLISSYSWNDVLGSLESPWLELVGRLQRAFGPHYAGIPLAGYRDLAPEVTESTFGDLVVLANWDPSGSYSTGGDQLAPHGFLARTKDGRLLAGAFQNTFDGAPLSTGPHYLIVERNDASVTVWQPLGTDTAVAVAPPSSWSSGTTLSATAIAADGTKIGAVGGTLRNGRFLFRYADDLDNQPVAAYRISIESTLQGN